MGNGETGRIDVVAAGSSWLRRHRGATSWVLAAASLALLSGPAHAATQPPTVAEVRTNPAAAAGSSVPAPAQPPVVSAHRAGASQWPENSLLAVGNSLQAGYQDIELDAWVTSDGGVVMWHDSRFVAARGCAGPYLDRYIPTMTFDQAMTMRCNGRPIATLWQVLGAAKASSNRTAVLRIEAKHLGSATDARRAADAVRIARVVRGYGMTSRVLLQDFNWTVTAKAVKAASPDQRLSMLFAAEPTWATIRAASRLHGYDVSYLGRYAKTTTNRAIRAYGMQPVVWTLDDAASARVAAATGVSVVISNAPDAIRTALAPGTYTCAKEVTPVYRWLAGTKTAVTWYLSIQAPVAAEAQDVVLRINVASTSATTTLAIGTTGSTFSSAWETRHVASPGTAVTATVPLNGNHSVRIRSTSSSAPLTGSVYATGYTTLTCS